MNDIENIIQETKMNDNTMDTNDNRVENFYTERRPMTTKEIKFFGTAISFDEQMAMKATAPRCSPKFLRTQSFGVLSPKSNRRKLFGLGSSDATSDIANVGGGGGGGDKNSNYKTLNYLLKSNSNATYKPCNLDCANTAKKIASVNKLMLIREYPAIDLDGFVESAGDIECSRLQRLNKLNRLKCRRINQFRNGRSVSCDSCDDMDKRYGFFSFSFGFRLSFWFVFVSFF